uniref:Coiled-coil domain-containing protein 103 n=1 Tax=Geotrypetes seraphini TaxID=260995 RepID=A0A6P8NSI4_GEOSA|nr:coiled-coil domain-containing protein 103 [Geotrypetes seraphini]XP_033773827.1 coiled-coil domain-containing protein 103 [Geotrypetes seraphini]XP_033773828.1 coiled-coil domain-containing protein 103 [Geotrypetes seraphini]XP_033773829.1 coiled-coil domain-containing protein 103 [Geotrypetes seraphini]XP_033773830.1 coiled-coil domain-containing protein 103 [Geotrypetes seraphini]
MEELDTFNFSALEKELQAALAADEKYQRENDAKFRAIHQKVASYEEFRDIVLASHLKPLKNKDKLGGKRNQPWNSCVTPDSYQQDAGLEIAQGSSQKPETSAEFNRDWRRYLRNGTEKYEFLLHFGGENLHRIFQVDIGFGLLGEFILVLAENFQSKDYDTVFQILQNFSQTYRFSLNLDLLSKAEKESCRDLFKKLQSTDIAQCTSDLASTGDAVEIVTELETYEKRENRETTEKNEKSLRELMRCYQIT